MISTVNFLGLRTFAAVALALGCLFVFFFATRFVLYEMRYPGWRLGNANRAAIAIMIFMFGETMSRGWGAVLTVAFSWGYDIGAIESQFPIAFVGSTIAFMGVLAKLRIFSPDDWGEWLWIIGGLVALAAAGLVVWL